MKSHIGSATKLRSKWKRWVCESARATVVSVTAIFCQQPHSFHIATILTLAHSGLFSEPSLAHPR